MTDERDWRDDFRLEVEAAKEGLHPSDRSALDAEFDVVVHRMELGDLRPLADCLCETDPPFGYALMSLLESGYLQVKVARRGAPAKPDLFARKLRMFLAYRDAAEALSSDDAFAKVAVDFRVSVETVRQAVTEIRKRVRNPKQPPPPLSLEQVRRKLGIKDVPLDEDTNNPPT
jgi:hypothetical protein